MMEEVADAAAPFSLLDLEPELILQALSTLSASDQARARHTCKLFAIIVDEIARTTSFMASVVGPMSTAVSDLSPMLEAQPTMGILFTKDEESEGSLADLARKLPYHCEVVGGDMSVVAGTDVSGTLVQSNDMQRGAAVRGAAEAALSLGRFPEATVRSFAVDASKGDDFRAQLQAEGALEPGWKVFLVVPRMNEADEVVELLQQAHPEAAVIGGIATGNALYRVRHQTAELIDEGCVGLMFSGNVPLAAFVSRGARALGEGPYVFDEGDSIVVGASSTQILTHVTDADGKRASALQAAIDSMAGARGGLCLGIADGPGEGYELQPLDNRMVVQSHGALVIPPRRGDDPQWQSGSLRFYSFDAESCKADLIRRLTELRADAAAKGDRMLGAVMFTCGGRTQSFFGEPAFDARTFCRIFDDTPLIGYYAGGEIGPPILADAPLAKAFQVGGAGMHGFTAVRRPIAGCPPQTLAGACPALSSLSACRAMHTPVLTADRISPPAGLWPLHRATAQAPRHGTRLWERRGRGRRVRRPARAHAARPAAGGDDGSRRRRGRVVGGVVEPPCVAAVGHGVAARPAGEGAQAGDVDARPGDHAGVREGGSRRGDRAPSAAARGRRRGGGGGHGGGGGDGGGRLERASG